MRISFALLAVIAVALPAKAQSQSNLRAGEHATFTRLVLDRIEPGTWSAERTSDGVNLALPEGIEVNTTAAFTRIPRTRVRTIDVERGSVAIRIACDCPVQVFDLAPSYLVIDIRDVGMAPEVEASDLAAQGSAEPPDPSPDLPSESLAQPNLSEVRRQLAEQIARAADQGLVTLSELETTANDATEPAAPVETGPSEPANLPPLPAEIAIRTAFDTPEARSQSAEATCHFPLPDMDGTAAERYRRYRVAVSTVFGEFDALDEERFREAMRLGIGLGLGRETLFLAGSVQTGDEMIPVYRDLARAIDDLGTGRAMLPYVECPGLEGLWARLALEDTEPELRRRFADADLATLSSIDPDGRVLLIERLATDWLALDMHAEAQQAVELAHRTGLELPATLELLELRISWVRGQSVDRGKLGTLAARSDRVGLDAQVLNADIMLVNDGRIPEGVRLDLVATAHLLRGTELGRRAIATLAAAYAAQDDLTSSLELLKEAAQEDEDHRDIWQRVAADLIETTAPDAPDYARAVLTFADVIPTDRTGADARAAAARGLEQLGLPNAAAFFTTDRRGATPRVLEATPNVDDGPVTNDVNAITALETPRPQRDDPLQEAERLIRTGASVRAELETLLIPDDQR